MNLSYNYSNPNIANYAFENLIKLYSMEIVVGASQWADPALTTIVPRHFYTAIGLKRGTGQISWPYKNSITSSIILTDITPRLDIAEPLLIDEITIPANVICESEQIVPTVALNLTIMECELRLWFGD